MARQTSIEAYNEIKENGLLKLRQMEVYGILFRHGPLTYNEVYDHLKQNSGGHFVGISSSRLTELRDLGVVSETGTIKDSFSGKRVIQWDVTKDLPVKTDKKETKDEIIGRLTAKIAELEKQLADRWDQNGQGRLL